MFAGADLSRIHRISSVKVTLPDGTLDKTMFSLERDLEKLDDALDKCPNVRMLVVDPVSAYMGKIDSHRDSDVRRVLTPLSELAERRRIAVVGVMHLKKSEASALHRLSGSVAFVAAARVVWGFGESPDDPESRVMVPVKNNLAALGNALGYKIETKDDI